MHAFAHDAFTFPLPEGHRFPQAKYRLVREAVEREGIADVQGAPAASWEELARAHTPAYLERVREGRLERREELALGLPWSPELVERGRRSVGSTLAAARAALRDGRAANLGGGTHHGFPDSGRGYCLLNDTVTAIRALRPALGRVLVCDLDVHQGDGNHAALAGDSLTFTFSVQGGRNYPFRRVPGDLELDLADGTGDEEYLARLEPLLAEAIERSRPALCFYLAGADPYAGDRLGRLALSRAGLAARDRLVRDALARAGVPVCVTLAGGYAEPIEDTAAIHAETVRVFAA